MDFIVIDNFLECPVQVREWALQQHYIDCKTYTKIMGQFTDWPGVRSNGVLDLDPIYANFVFSKVADIIKKNSNVENMSIRSYFQLTKTTDGASWVHQDNNMKYAAILYLNPDSDPRHGTTFYRCNNLAKWESYMLDEIGYNTATTINEQENTALFEELFTPVDIIGNVFNRLVLYKGDIYHKSTSYFGEILQNSRLTQVFFIQDES